MMIPQLVSAGATLLGGFLGRQHQDEQRSANERLQREFAQSSIQWRVADAKKAGIHPLYALGSPSISPAVSVQGDPLGASLGAMGQDLSRAAMANKSQGERDEAMSNTLQHLALERAGLQNELLRSQIMRLKAQNSPPVPSETAPFDVTQDPKIEQRPQLMLGGERWRTSPGTSPMEAFEKQYGDEGIPAWLIPMIIMYQDMKTNVDHPWGEKRLPSTFWRWINDLADRHINAPASSRAPSWSGHRGPFR